MGAHPFLGAQDHPFPYFLKIIVFCNHLEKCKVARKIKTSHKEKAGPSNIALLQMKKEAQLNRFVHLSSLSLAEYKLQSNKRLTHEHMIYHGLSTNKLQKGQVTIHSMLECRKAYPRKEIQSSQLCARNPVTKTDS